jgi:broad specificity phosphatase PhoE
VLEISLATSLILLCTASTPLGRLGGFASPDDAVDERGLRDAAACRVPDRYKGAVMTSPARAARETASAMGLGAAQVPALADIDHGDWSGRSFADIEATDPGALLAWLGDPTQGAPGGEPMAQVCDRVGQWMDGIAASPGAVCAVTHAMTIRAALSRALGIPLPATLAIDVAPLSQATLSFNGRWRLQSLCPR